MVILAHRGLWHEPEERNTLPALRRALEAGFGVETDIRDYMGRLVISHNVADEAAPLAEELFAWYREADRAGQLALNVKADGIQTLLVPLLEKYGLDDYFLFDMSVPEAVVNRGMSLRYYTRQSDVEHACVLYDRACGVWMDSFYSDVWLTEREIEKHLANGKRVCLVSPELHGKDEEAFWALIKRGALCQSAQIALCTDKPVEAREYFYGE